MYASPEGYTALARSVSYDGENRQIYAEDQADCGRLTESAMRAAIMLGMQLDSLGPASAELGTDEKHRASSEDAAPVSVSNGHHLEGVARLLKSKAKYEPCRGTGPIYEAVFEYLTIPNLSVYLRACYNRTV